MGIGNPKSLLFFSALCSQFMDASLPIAGQLGVLALVLGYVLCGATLLVRLQQGARAAGFSV